MKCPKCHYLSFEPEPRCRHCGYDFSMTDSPLPPMSAAPPAPAGLTDLPLRDAADVRVAAPAPASLGLMRPERPREPARPAAAEPAPPAPLARPQSVVPASTSPTSELPLFVKPTAAPAVAKAPEPPEPREVPAAPLGPVPLDHDAVKVPTAPAPLAVRRKSPDLVRAKSGAPSAADRHLGPLERDLLEDLERIEADEVRRTQPDAGVTEAQASSRVARIGAAVIDLILLAGLNSAIVWLTLRQTGLAFAELPGAALAPLVGFLWLIDLGYLLMFTASSGQTIGKMLLRLRVIDESEETLTIGRAAYRALLTFPSVLPLGAGFLPALFGGGALHDRLSHTRVVRA